MCRIAQECEKNILSSPFIKSILLNNCNTLHYVAKANMFELGLYWAGLGIHLVKSLVYKVRHSKRQNTYVDFGSQHSTEPLRLSGRPCYKY